MARPKAADHEQHRAAIRLKAVEAFARTGYASASMVDLAKACGVSKAALYHYFPSKEAILFEALDEYTARLDQLTKSITDLPAENCDEARDLLKQLVKALMQEYEHSHNFHVSLLHDIGFLGDLQRAKIRRQERTVVHRFGGLLEAAFPGRIEPNMRSATSMALLGMVNFTFAWLRPKGSISYDDFAELVIDLWWNGLANTPPTGEKISVAPPNAKTS